MTAVRDAAMTALLLRTLRTARELLMDRERWMQGRWASGPLGERTFPESPESYRFCLAGAVRRAAVITLPQAEHERGKLVETAQSAIVPAGLQRYRNRVPKNRRHPANVLLMAFNDSPFTMHGHVIAVLDQTIERMQADA